MDVYLPGGVSLIDYGLIAAERFDRTRVALLGGVIVVALEGGSGMLALVRPTSTTLR